MNGLVISGGGNKGSAGAGKIAAINGEYDFGVGVSTGALMLIPALLSKHKLLKETYTNVKPSQVFDFNPFNSKGHIKVWYLIWRLITGKPTLAESYALRRTLHRLYDENNLWELLKVSGKVAYVGVYNDTLECMEYPCSNMVTKDDWIDYTWASACQPPAMSIMRKNFTEYLDGGVQEVLPMEYAAKVVGTKHLTIVAHRPNELPNTHKKPIQNLLHHAARLIIGMRKEILKNDLKVGKFTCEARKVDYDLHFVSQGYGENDLLFDKKRMAAWYNSANTEPLKPEVVRF